jgi:hypothetical protein
MGPYGTFEQGSNLMVDADASGKFYMGGVQRGTVDWGNGYISSTPGIVERKIAVTCIDMAGKVQWVKMGGGSSVNYMYALSVTNNGTCYFTGSFSDTAMFDTITINTSNFFNFALGKISPASASGVDEIFDDEISIYPNPSTGIVYVPDELANSGLDIFDAAGKLVRSEQISGKILNMKQLAPGVYSMVFHSGNKISRTRLIIMN